MGVLRTVRKRDGREVAFDRTKIADAIHKAACASGGPDRQTAEELAGAVTHFIRKQYADRVPTIEEIQDLVERVLMETGYTDTARAYILYREERRKIREALSVLHAAPQALSDRPADVVVDAAGAELVGTWSKGRIVEALIREAGLGYDASASVANAVEGKVFGSGIKRISTTLIRELVDNELFERGYSAKLTRQTLVGIPKYDLARLLLAASEEKPDLISNNPDAVAMGIAEGALKQYALGELFPPEVTEAHLNAEIHLVDLGHPARYHSAVHSVDYIKKFGLSLNNLQSVSAPARHARTLTAHLGTFLASMQAYFSGPQGLPFINVFYAPMVEGTSAERMYQEAQSLIFCGSQIAFARGGHTLPLYFGIHSCVPDFLRDVEAIGPGGEGTGRPYAYYGQTAAAFARLMLDAWRAGDAKGDPFRYPACYLHLDTEDDRENLHFLAREGTRGSWTPQIFVDEIGSFQATPSLRFALDEDNAGMARCPESIRCAAAHAVVINLARAAFRAGRGNTRGMAGEVAQSAIRACEAHRAKGRFLSSLSAAAGKPLYELGRTAADGEPYFTPERAIYLVGYVGLEEALEYLYGEPGREPEARRIVTGLEERMAKESERMGFHVALDPNPPLEAARRLALTDMRFYPQAGELKSGRAGADGALYSRAVPEGQPS